MISKLTITRERLSGIARGENCYTHDDVIALALAQLASMDSEPVAQIEVLSGVLVNERWMHQSLPNGWHDLFACRHAQQAPVVVCEGRDQFEEWMLKRWGRERHDNDFAMGKFIYGEDYADSYTRCVWKAWSASRTAMLNGGQS
ncbi:hypothetical protein [Klebsiella aerogenes]|uniref:hypothetical protein n=1 Tax=Klebsiella aerogenes TaxID=548 RepID=UPI002073C61F|nr:hypothetical protein [Klebsiella aerogenes]